MDIIAAHQQGLIEQLDTEIADLAGRPMDFSQRAIVLHHLYDHSNGAHQWALIEADRALRIARGLAALRRKAGSWRWKVGSKIDAAEALDALAEALGQESKARFVAAYRAYRLSATQALRSEAEDFVPADLLSALDACHEARRSGAGLDPAGCQALRASSEAFAADRVIEESSAWSAIERTRLHRSAKRMLGTQALDIGDSRASRKGLAWLDRRLRSDPLLPATFKANAAQHFYALQHGLREKRRNRWREACDRESDAVLLAA